MAATVINIEPALRHVKNTATYGTTTVMDLALGDLQVVTLTGNITTLTLQNMVDGQDYTLCFIQGVGSSTLAIPGNLKLTAGALTLTATNGKRDTLVCWSDGTNLYEKSRALNV